MEIGTDSVKVLTLGEARAGLNGIVARFRAGEQTPVVVGPHRKPQAVVVPIEAWEQLTAEGQS